MTCVMRTEQILLILTDLICLFVCRQLFVVCLSVHSSVSLSVCCPFVHLHVSLSVYLFVCLFSVYLLIRLSVCLSVCPSICLFVRPFVCLYQFVDFICGLVSGRCT